MARGGKKGGGNGGGDDGGSTEEGVSLRGNRKDNRLEGSDFDDTILGGRGNDTLIGKAGDDFLFGEEGDDSIDGGAGNDRIFGGSGTNTLNGGDGNDEIFGGSDGDLINGGSGDDTLLGSLGEDTINGGSDGYDTAEFTDIGGLIPLSGDPDVVTVDGITLTATGEKAYDADLEIAPGSFETDTLTNISRVVGTNFNDAMTGGIYADDFSGAQGDDLLIGGAGEDTLYGGQDDDTLEGGTEADTFIFLRVADGIVEPDPPIPDDPNAGNYDDAGRGDGTDVIVDFNAAEGDTIIFLTNEEMVLSSTTDDDGNTVLVYGGDGFYGPSEITLQGVTDDADALLASGDIVIMVDAGFEFIL